MSKLTTEVGNGWRLLKDGEPLKPGDGFIHPDWPHFWTDFNCRPDIFRGSEGLRIPKNDVAHTFPWRRRTHALLTTSATQTSNSPTATKGH